MMRQGGAPTLMAGLGDTGAAKYSPPDGTEARTYDAILGGISIGEEVEYSGGGGSVGGKAAIQRRTIKVIPKQSPAEIVDTGKFEIAGDEWSIERVSSATPAMIVIELRRERDRELPRARRR